MLVLSRRIGERIRIGDDIELTILSYRGRSVIVGIEAPQEIPIRREEILRRGAGTAASGPSCPREADQLLNGVGAMPREDRVVPGTQPAAVSAESLRGPLSGKLASRSTELVRRAVG